MLSGRKLNSAPVAWSLSRLSLMSALPPLVLKMLNVTEPCFQKKVPLHILYIALGGGAAILNLPIILTIFKHPALKVRKEYCIIAGLAGADFVEGFATMLAGVYRLSAYFTNFLSTRISPLYCMFLPFSFLWRWSDFATSLMLLAVSIDRLLAVRFPAKYFHYQTGYAFKLIAIVYIFSFISWCFCWIYPISKRETLIYADCASDETISPLYYQYSKYFTFVASALSVMVYGVVVVLVHKRDHSTPRQQTLLRHNRAQRNITIALGISSVCTLFLDAIPRAWGVYLLISVQGLGVEARYFFLFTKLNAMANCLIYSLRLWEIRHGMYSLIRCKQLPLSLDSWERNSSIRSARRCSNPRRSLSHIEMERISDMLL